MRPRTEAELEAELYRSWQQLRETGRLDEMLPRCTRRSWLLNGQRHGYVTLDYKVLRQLRLPSAWGHSGDGIADLVEIYWAVRTLGGVQNLNWAPSLVANVIELKNESLSVSNLEQLYRYTIALRAALHSGAISGLLKQGRPVELHVRGLLLGPSVPEAVNIVDALATFVEVPISVGRFEFSATDGLLFHRTGGEERFFETGIFDRDRLDQLGHELVGNDQLIRSQGFWTMPEDSRAELDS
jgi:hypothetical protein